MHGLGNDYIFLNCMEAIPENLEDLARKLSDRHFGVGGDGIICVCPSKRSDFRMLMFNADGSEGAMCGNGIRCFGKYVFDKGLTDRAHLAIETSAGERELSLMIENGKAVKAVVDMGCPVIQQSTKISVNGNNYTVIPVSMGNSHGVMEVDNLATLNLRELGPAFECHPAFGQRINAEFVHMLGRGLLELRVWERGSGETLACGTGACAAVCAMAAAGKLDRDAEACLPGGRLQIRWDDKSGHVFMTGPAVTVFDGELAD